jgi:ABC-type branched-subunit amino acid transport system ATPase component
MNLKTMIGSNGAGKSTALKAVSGLLGAFSGQITQSEVFLHQAFENR